MEKEAKEKRMGGGMQTHKVLKNQNYRNTILCTSSGQNYLQGPIKFSYWDRKKYQKLLTFWWEHGISMPDEKHPSDRIYFKAESLNNFKIYVNQNDYFMRKLPPIEPEMNDWLGPFQKILLIFMLLFSICFGYYSGICVKHLTFSKYVHPMTTSFLFKYITVRKLFLAVKKSESVDTIMWKLGAFGFKNNFTQCSPWKFNYYECNHQYKVCHNSDKGDDWR